MPVRCTFVFVLMRGAASKWITTLKSFLQMFVHIKCFVIFCEKITTHLNFRCYWIWNYLEYLALNLWIILVDFYHLLLSLSQPFCRSVTAVFIQSYIDCYKFHWSIAAIYNLECAFWPILLLLSARIEPSLAVNKISSSISLLPLHRGGCSRRAL